MGENDSFVEDLGTSSSFDEYYQNWSNSQSQQPQINRDYTVITAKDVLETEYPETNWIIEKVLPEEGITLIVGEAGTFKSFFCLYLTKALVTQEPFLGHFQVFRNCRVLIIDKENKLRRLKKRMVGLNFPKCEDVFFLEYPEKFRFENNEFVKFVSEFIKQEKIDVVIFDSFIDMFDGNENSSTDTSRAFDAIRNLSHTCTYIAIHHDSKPIPKVVRTAAQKTRGSSNIIAQVDTQFYFEKSKENNKLIVDQGKSRDEEPLKRFSVKVQADGNGISDFIYEGEVKNDIVLIEETANLMYEYIQEHNLVSKEELFDAVTSEIECGERTLNGALSNLKKRVLIDAVRKPGEGNKMFYISLTSSEPEPSSNEPE